MPRPQTRFFPSPAALATVIMLVLLALILLVTQTPRTSLLATQAAPAPAKPAPALGAEQLPYLIAGDVGVVPWRTNEVEWLPGDVPNGLFTLQLSRFALQKAWNAAKRREEEEGKPLVRVEVQLAPGVVFFTRPDPASPRGRVSLKNPDGGSLDLVAELRKYYKSATGEWMMSLGTDEPCEWTADKQSPDAPPADPATTPLEKGALLGRYRKSIRDKELCPAKFTSAPVVLPAGATNPSFEVAVALKRFMKKPSDPDGTTSTVGPSKVGVSDVQLVNRGKPAVIGPGPGESR